MSDIQKQFKQELKALLTKYNATIGFDVAPCSDTHGLYDERMVATYHDTDKRVHIELLSVDGWNIDKYEIED